MIDIVSNNFIGCSSKDKLIIFSCFENYLVQNNSKMILNSFRELFSSYISGLKDYVNFCDNYMAYNSVVNRYLRGMILEYLYKKIDSHHMNYNQMHTINNFKYKSSEYIYEAKEREAKRYFNPDVIDSSLVDAFIADFEDMKPYEKDSLIEEFCDLYSRVSEFSLLIPQFEIDSFENILDFFLGEGVVRCYKKLYPAEKMMFIDTFSSSFSYLELDNIKNNEDRDYVKNLKHKLENKVDEVFGE